MPREAPRHITPTQLEETFVQLVKNYDVLRRQAIHGFILTSFFMVLGFVVVVFGMIIRMLGFTNWGIHELVTIAEIVMQLVSGLALIVHGRNFQRLNLTSDKLLETWKILTAFRKAETLPDKKREAIIVSLISILVTKESRMQDNKVDS